MLQEDWGKEGMGKRAVGWGGWKEKVLGETTETGRYLRDETETYCNENSQKIFEGNHT